MKELQQYYNYNLIFETRTVNMKYVKNFEMSFLNS